MGFRFGRWVFILLEMNVERYVRLQQLGVISSFMEFTSGLFADMDVNIDKVRDKLRETFLLLYNTDLSAAGQVTVEGLLGITLNK